MSVCVHVYFCLCAYSHVYKSSCMCAYVIIVCIREYICVKPVWIHTESPADENYSEAFDPEKTTNSIS